MADLGWTSGALCALSFRIAIVVMIVMLGLVLTHDFSKAQKPPPLQSAPELRLGPI